LSGCYRFGRRTMDKNARPEANQLDCRRIGVYIYINTHTIQYPHTSYSHRMGFYCSCGQSCMHTHIYTQTHVIYLYYIMFKHTQQSFRISDARKRAARTRFPTRSDVTEVLFLFYFYFGISIRACVCRVKRPIVTGTRSSILCNINAYKKKCVYIYIYIVYTGYRSAF
jgi:hypothetical protein